MFNIFKGKSPQLSIILPTYNREILLRHAIDSALIQSFDDFELIVINDGSTDRSGAIIEAYTDSRIMRVAQRRQGEYASTNKGIKLARGRYITWLHSDDILPMDSLLSRVNRLESDKRVDFCHGDIKKIDHNGAETETLVAFDGEACSAFEEYYKPEPLRLQKYPIHHTTIMFRRNFVSRVGYWDEQLPFAGDLDWMLRALRIGRMEKASGILYLYRIHDQARSVMEPKLGLDPSAIVNFILARYKHK